MSNQITGSDRLSASRESASRVGGADQTSSGISDGIRNATEQAKLAGDAAEAITGDLKEYCNHQLRSGAKIGNHFASSLRVSASALPPDAAMLASAIRSVAKQVDAYATELGRQNVEQVAASASSFIRRRPALIFGVTALAGFAAFRMFKSAQAQSATSQRTQSISSDATQSPSIQPTENPVPSTQSPLPPGRSPSGPVHG
jgi:hypothetical protein